MPNPRPSAGAPRSRPRSTYPQRLALVLATTVTGLAGFSGTVAAFAASPADLLKAGDGCMREQDHKCAAKKYGEYLKARPTDSSTLARMGISLARLDRNEEAIAAFEKSIDMGEGTYDLFAFYATCLEKVGRVDEAIDWNYKALSLVERLVDVRGDLAKLLVSKGRHHEALALLGSFDSARVAEGKESYFGGQRIAIESSLARRAARAKADPKAAPGATASAAPSFRAPKYEDHFYVPVGHPETKSMTAFLVDTGASKLVVNPAHLKETGTEHVVVKEDVPMLLADGRKVKGRLLRIASLSVGPFVLEDVEALSCEKCALLVGQNVLGRFDLKTQKVEGVEFLSLNPRGK